MIPPGLAWQRLLLLQDVLAEQPELARALRRLSLYDQLAMTLELLHDSPGPAEALPANVIPFRRTPRNAATEIPRNSPPVRPRS